MKTNATKRLLALFLTLAMLLPCLSGTMLNVQADTATAESKVYDIYDLTGSQTNTVKGTDETWDGVLLGTVSEEHKENIVFKTKLTMGQQEVRLSLNALEGASIYDPSGYAVFINHNSGAPYIAIKRNMTDLVVGSVASVAGTYELEIGILDILTDGVRTGKHLYVKKDGVTVCEVDDTSGCLTGDTLGTRIIDFHYGAAIQMDTTYAESYGTAQIYDIYDLTGATSNTIQGTDSTWDGQIHAYISEEHKENFAFKTKLTMETQNVRLSLTAQDGDSHYDPVGYAVYLYGAENKIELRRNNGALKSATVDSLAGTYIFEVGVVDILFNGERTGKYLYVKINDEIVCEYEDASGYLTGDNLGTKIIDFHYGASIQMDTTYEASYGAATVYDIYDLTGSASKQVNAWECTQIGSIAEEHKEQAALQVKMSITNERHRYRFAVGNTTDGNGWDPLGYSVEIAVALDNQNHVKFLRNGSQIAYFDDVSGLIGEHVYEFGYRNITMGNTVTGKQVYLKVDGVVLYSFDDCSGYLTGDALGNIVTLNQIDDSGAISLNTAYESTYGTATVYDIYDLTGATSNTIQGTDSTWDGQIHAYISEVHKENFAFKTKLTMETQNVRLSLTARDGDSLYDPVGYAVYLYGAENKIELRRNNGALKSATVDSLAGTYIFEVGVVDILFNGERTGKYLYVKINDEIVCEYEDASGYLTGDTLGTKIIDFHYGASIQMDTTYESGYGEVKQYDIWDFTGAASNTVDGTGNGNWSATVLGHIDSTDKENMSLLANVTITDEAVYRFSLSALNSDECIDPAGYGVVITIGSSGSVSFTRGAAHTTLATYSGDATSLKGEYVLEIGYRDILFNGEIVGKQIFLKKDGEILYSYDDCSDYLTGDALGTKAAIFHYGTALEMDSTIPSFVHSYNLTLGGSTIMNLRLDPAVIGDNEAIVHFVLNGEETTYAVNELSIDAQGMRVVSVHFAAAQMRDSIALTVTLADGRTMTKNYSIVGYAKHILEGDSYTAEQKAVVEAMLHYGAAAQNYFNYNTGALANEGYTDSVTNTIGSTFSSVKTGKVTGVSYYGSSLLMAETISLRHYLNITGDVDSYEFTFNGEAVTPVSSTKISGANYFVQLDDILPNELDGVYILTISDGSSSFTLDYSPMSYVQRMSTKDTSKELVQQLYDYHIAAKELASSKVVDEATVLDLYQLSGNTSITVPDDQVMQVGVLVGAADNFVERELTSNVAVRFKYTGYDGMRFQLGASTSEISSASGALFMSVPVNNSFGIANIADNGTWQQNAAGNDLFSWQTCLGQGQVSYIELGCVRRYTDGVYTHDRYYVRAAATLAELDAMAQNGTFSVYYDTTMKDNLGYNVILRERISGDGDVLETTWTEDEILAYESRISTIAQSVTSVSYDDLEKKHSVQVTDTSNTAASVAAAKTPTSTEATGGDELILWAESGTAKIVQDDDGKAASLAAQKNNLTVQMAKNEDEGAQLMLFGSRNVEGYEIFVTDLVSGSNVISADNIRLYQLKYVTIDDKASGYYDTPDAYVGEKLPDGMLPFAKAVEYGENVILAGNNQAIYVDISTKSTDAAGTYTGTIVVKTNTDQVYTLPISVVVQDVVLPEVSQLGTYAPCLDRDSFTTGELDGSDQMAELYMNVMQDFNMSAASPISNNVLDLEQFLVSVRRNYDNVSNYLLPVDNSDSYYNVDGTETLVYCNYALLKEYVVALAQMSVADGVNYLDKAFFYPSDHADESNTEAEFNIAKATYQAFCQMLDDADAELTALYSGTSMYTAEIADSVKNLRFLLTIPSSDDNGRTLDVGVLLTDFLSAADRKNVVLSTTNDVLVREEYGEAVASAMSGAYADELWTYLCLSPYTPYSNYAFDTSVVSLRALGWTCYQENVDTLMAWSSVNYLYGSGGLTLDRWETSSAGTNTVTPGDGNVFYPGAKYGIDGPCPSLRAIAWRDGVDDYSLMCAVMENGGSADTLNSLYGLITESYTDTIKASTETGSWWASLFSKNVDATVPIDDDAKFTVVRNALLQMAVSDSGDHTAILSNAQTAVDSVVTATGTVAALEDPASESTVTISGNNYTDGYYQLADFESYAETTQNKFSGNAQLSLVNSAKSGSYSLKLEIEPGEKGEKVMIPTTSKYFSATTDFSGASKITFKVYNAQSSDSTVRFYLNTYDRSGDVYNTGTYYKADEDVWHDDLADNASFHFTLAPGWNEITINASDIGTDYLSYVGLFVIAFDGGNGFSTTQVFYLDDVRVYMDQVS